MFGFGRRGLARWRKPEDRAAELKRMRAIAALLLVSMTIVFIATTVTKSDQVWIPYLRAFAEAAMVGACADWFAVVALFRRPFGLPIPHTAIIPANQQRIGESLGRFITNNFLTRKAISRKLAEIDIAGSIARWLGDPVNAKKLAAYGGHFLPEILKKVPRHRLGQFVGSISRRSVDSIPAALLASRVLETLWAQGQTQALLDSAIEHGRNWLASHEAFIQQQVVEKSSRWVPKWLDAMLAKRIITGLLATIEEMRNPDHPWRVELREAVEKMIVDLATDPDMRARGETLKAQWFAHPTFLAQIEFLWTRIEESLYSDLPGQVETIAAAIEAALLGLAKWLDEEPALPAMANRRIRLMLLRLFIHRRVEIGSYIARVVQTWDASTLVSKLELQVGKDLQYVRINGTLVGGLVGLAIFAATRWFESL
jgi:uncharacterized membrane-anchored protein YjiN (DUF445 family)